MGIGSSAKKANQQAIDMQNQAAAEAKAQQNKAIEMKQKAIADNPYPTYLSTPEAQKYKQTLEDRLAGKGLIDVNALTSPIAAQIRAGEKQTEAGIGSAASARGLGRSTVATSQIGAASQAAERDIAERMANLELTRQQQIENAVGQYGNLASTEAQSQANKANYNVGNEFNVSDSIANYAQLAKNDQFTISKTIQESGAQEAAFKLQQLQMWLSVAATAGSIAATGGMSAAIPKSGAVVNTGNSKILNSNFNMAGIGDKLGGF